MTDNEFKKVIEQCKKNETCIGCPLEHLDYASECVSAIIEHCDLNNKTETKSVFEFAERLHKEIQAIRNRFVMGVPPYTALALEKFDRIIDKVLKETVGADNG